MFTIRKISNGVGVERIFPLYSPHIDSIEINKRGVVRRARIYYLRDLTGKKARIKEKRMPVRKKNSLRSVGQKHKNAPLFSSSFIFKNGQYELNPENQNLKKIVLFCCASAIVFSGCEKESAKDYNITISNVTGDPTSSLTSLKAEMLEWPYSVLSETEFKSGPFTLTLPAVVNDNMLQDAVGLLPAR